MLLDVAMRVVGTGYARIPLLSRPSVVVESAFNQKVMLIFSLREQMIPYERTWGTHFAGTKEPASKWVTPVFASRLTSSIFVCSGIDFSFCKPSRGPTSTIRAWSAFCGIDVLKLLQS